ncbi:MAG: hypothetical protein NUV63_11045 [Gallionella sp.]|nr:hypothetical protein [Gallionella sp.]
MSKPDSLTRIAIPEHLMLSRLAQSEQMREFFIQMWLQNPVLAKQGGSKVHDLLFPLAAADAEETCSNPNSPKSMMDKKQSGFSLVSAIFLLVVIAALGTFAVTLSTTQHQSAAFDVMGARGYQAARAGIEWAAFQVINSPLSAVAPAPCATNFAQNSLGGTLDPFAVAVTCAAASHIEDTSTVWIYDVSAVAQTAGSPGDTGYVERAISVKMGR